MDATNNMRYPGGKPDLDMLYQSVTELIRKRQIACEQLNEEQLATVFTQAIACQDIIKLVRQGDSAQCFIYVPYAQEERSQARIRRLEKALADHGIADPDKLEPMEDES